jgi:hypothetical protein
MEDKLDRLIALLEKQNKLISRLGLIVARMSYLLLAVISLFVIAIIIQILF